MQLAVRRIIFRVANPKITHEVRQLKSQSRIPFYPVVGLIETKTGAMILNKPDNNNNVTEECADELFRFLNSYHHDHTVENVWIQNRGPSFSGGADLQQLVNNSNYLDKLMRLSIKIGQFNKPIFAKVHGGVRGIAAYILTMFSTPLGTQKSSLRLDETAKGFIPIFGGSHKLSRLPCNIGIYLALSGDRLDADQMARLGFLKGRVRDQFTNKQIRKHLSDANLFNRHPYTPSSHSLSQVRRQNVILIKKNYFNDMVAATQREIFNSGGNFNSKLALNQYRVAQTDYHNMLQPFNSFSVNHIPLNNYFEMKHDRPFKYLKEKGIVQEGLTNYNLISRLPVHKLLKVFNQNSIQQVLEQLKRDDSEWARRTEQQIRNKDPLAVHLTFSLLKKAKSLSWVECLEEQYKIARRILNISKINHKQVSGGKYIITLQNEYSEQKLQNISKQVVQQFLKPAQNDSQKFDHDTPNHSLLPTSDFWKQIPDAGRNYLNRTFFQDIHAKFGQVQVVRFLNANKIDYRDSSYNIATLRQYIYKKFEYEKFVQLEKQRIKGIFQSEQFYTQLKKKRNEYLKQQIKRPQLHIFIAQQIQLYFQQKFNTRYNELEKTAKIAGKESRLSIIRKYIKTLTENIVFNGRKIENKDRINNVRHLGIVRFDQKNSDAFTAENQHQKSIEQLNILKKAFKNNRNKEDLAQIDPQKPKQEYMFFQNQLTKQQQDIIKKNAVLKLNYDHDKLITKQKAIDYKMLIENAATTSEQIVQLLGWTNEDIQGMVANSPKSQTLFKQFAESTLENSNLIQQRINHLNNFYKQFKTLQQNVIPKIIDDANKQPVVQNIFFDSKIIPQQFREAHLALFKVILDFYSSKYVVNNSISYGINTVKSYSFIEEWAKQGLQSSFSKLMKNDVQYTFSYVVVLYLKQILVQLQKQKIKNMGNISKVLSKKFGIELQNMQLHQFNKIFTKYLYAVLDLHEQSKHKIIFPQTKLLQFIHQFKINAQLKPKSNLSFQSFMLLIAKDRKRIRDVQNGSMPLLGYDPQVALNSLVLEQKQNDFGLPLLKQFYNLSESQKKQFNAYLRLRKLSTNLYAQQGNKDSLILGFPHYLRRFQAMIQQVAGRTMFLPKQLYDCHSKKLYEIAKDLLKIQLTNQQWLKQKIRSAIRNVMQFRFEKEKQMSQGQLALFDEQFSQLFTSDMLQLLIKYESYNEEAIAKIIISDQKKSASTNQQIESYYLDLKSEIKNPRALKMFNNLIMTENIIKDRFEQMSRDTFSKSSQGFIKQQQQDMNAQKKKYHHERTYQRLTNEALRYPDDQNGLTLKNVKNIRQTLGFKTQYKESTFLNQIKQITQLASVGDLKAQLQDRINRISAPK